MSGCCDESRPAGRDGTNLEIAVAGNPNCGKSALFNTLTGIRQRTGNWPGVTVDRKQGTFDLDDRRVRLVDLPGIYSLDAASIDERITRDYLLSGAADLIVNVVDATNLERNLYLSVQLLEMGVPMVVAVNMMDVARRRGLIVDTASLSGQLGCPVVPIVAVSGEGISELKARMAGVAAGDERSGFSLAHDEVVEQAIADIEPLLVLPSQAPGANRRWLTLKMLESTEHETAGPSESTAPRITSWRRRIEQRTGEEADLVISDARFSHAHALASMAVRHRGRLGPTLSDRVDRVVLGRWLGVPVFLAIMYLMFMLTINVGGAFIDLFDGVAGAFFVDGARHWIAAAGAPAWIGFLVADGVGAGVRVVATFIPIIASLYLFLSALEDSGYMARAAFVMDRFMRAIGLPGKAFVPMIVGFGCNVPAVLATRTLENERERKLTVLMNPFMSCGARLPVYALFAAAFFPDTGQNVVFLLYLVGIAAAVISGLIMNRTLLAGESAGFMMELPPYHLPTLKGVALRTWDRVRLFIKEAGQVIVVMVLALNLLNFVGSDGSLGNRNPGDSALGELSRALTPVFAPLGIDSENWPAVVGVFSGVLAKEVVVGTLDTLYSRLGDDGLEPSGDTDEFQLAPALSEAFSTVPANLSSLGRFIADPLGLDIGNTADTGRAADEQQVDAGTFGAMAARFDGKAGAFAYLLFVLLYFPCAATVGAIRRETGTRWAVFVTFWTTLVAYVTASLFYQAATFARHPAASTAWIVGLLVVFAVVVAIIKGQSARMTSATQPSGAGT